VIDSNRVCQPGFESWIAAVTDPTPPPRMAIRGRPDIQAPAIT